MESITPVVLFLFITDVWSTFCPVISPFGDLVYFADTPASSWTSTSLTQCATGCAFSRSSSRGNTSCRGFSYNASSSNCSIYSSDPQIYKFDSSGNVVSYQFSNQPIKSPWLTVSPSQCDFPYEYNGQLHRECRYEAPRANSKCAVGRHGCRLSTGVQAFCDPHLAYTGTAGIISSVTYQYVDVQSCSFPYTYNGFLYNSCMRNVDGVTNDFHPAACKTVNQTVVRCKPPAVVDVVVHHFGDYVAKLTNYTVKVSGQPDQWTLSVFEWIFIMRRQVGYGDGNWKLAWVNYVNGFGPNETYSWLGLERVHQLTTKGSWRLRLEYYFNNTWVSAEYWTFTLSDSHTFYTLKFDGYSGDDGDRLRAPGLYAAYNNNGMKFSTYDLDNDNFSTGKCTSDGGWWYNVCGLTYFTFASPRILDGGVQYPTNEVHLMMKAR